MRRPSTALAVDTAHSNEHDLTYDLELSPRSSIFSQEEIKQTPAPAPTSTPTPAPIPSLQPSIKLLFSLLSQRHLLFLLLPAIASSIIAGGIAPFMTYVIGQAFDAFAQFPQSPNPSQEAKDKLLHGVGLAAVQLIALAVGSLALSSLTSSLWIWTGENNVMALRKRVYAAVTRKDMVWFDTKMGADASVESADSDPAGPLGAGGLMAKFTRETDDVRMASSLASGMLIQYLTTCITCLVLAFLRSWALTLVILSAVPILMVIQGFSQATAGPLLAQERSQTATAATLVDRAVAAISTVKAFNAAPYEQKTLSAALDRISAAARRLNSVWGVTSCLAQFVMMGMFVQGFWFGAKLVRDGKISAGDVMAVFWACLIATSNLQMCIPQFITLAKGKFAIVSLLSLLDAPSSSPSPPSSPSSIMSRKPAKRSTHLRKITPVKCGGELALQSVSFAYPSRPTVPVLTDVSLYLPANETTFIVGASGSGKSTIAQLLLRLYTPDSGAVLLDDQDVRFLDEDWARDHIAGVEQGCVLFDMSVHDNVAIGVSGGRGRREVTRQEVVEACRAALMNEFIRDLPDGYDTMLGSNGASLSGGQRQRLAIARAKLRDPTILILDEATSALDPTSRILVFEALKRWRENKTTIVITHDLSQITPADFVYVLRAGCVVEQGYRADLEAAPADGEFRAMLEVQNGMGGFLPAKDVDDQEAVDEDVVRILDEVDSKEQEEASDEAAPLGALKHQSLARPALKRITLGNWMFDVVADLTSGKTAPMDSAVVAAREPARLSRFVPQQEQDVEIQEIPRARRPSSVHISTPTALAISIPSPAYTVATRRFSLQFTPTSPVFSFHTNATATSLSNLLDNHLDNEYAEEKSGLERTAALATTRRGNGGVRARWDGGKVVPRESITISTSPVPEEPAQERPQPFWQLIRQIYPTVPNKPVVALGLVICLLSGAMTPVFSFLLSRLLFEVSIGARNVGIINTFGGIVLAVAAADGLLMGTKYAVMEGVAMAWVTKIRKAAFAKVMAQDRAWFDKEENSAPRLVQILVKDGDDARNLIAVVLGQCAVVTAMLGVGLIWALVRGWQLTLVGLAIAPIFAATMAVQTGLVARCEMRNKRAREDVAKGYYEAISNIRGIRSMAFEKIFQSQFDKAADRALSTGVRGAFVEGCTYGVASGLIYLAEALLFYIGAVLIARGTYTYLQMVEVLNLVVFTVTIGSQLMAFTQKIAKSTQATSDFNRLLRLPTDTAESRGLLRPELTGAVTLNNVAFSYPERPDAPVLKDVNLRIAEGECVAIVGASGSGKSTIAALLQRLYEPTNGSLAIGPHPLAATDVHHLRHHVSVVSQQPFLFDASISDNIAYGNPSLSTADIERAAQAAHVHDFIMGLPNGYDTTVGENATLISGGQAQRLQIARALARPSRVLILDECTSALDPANQAAVIETIKAAKVGRTTVVVTHKLPVMRMCDRVVVVHEGTVVEQGTYEELVERKGTFATLARGGEWE